MRKTIKFTNSSDILTPFLRVGRQGVLCREYAVTKFKKEAPRSITISDTPFVGCKREIVLARPYGFFGWCPRGVKTKSQYIFILLQDEFYKILGKRKGYQEIFVRVD